MLPSRNLSWLSLHFLLQTPAIDFSLYLRLPGSQDKADNSMSEAKTQIKLFIAEMWSSFHLSGPR